MILEKIIMVVSKGAKGMGRENEEKNQKGRRGRDQNNAEVLSIPSVEAGEIGAQVIVKPHTQGLQVKELTQKFNVHLC